MLVIRTLIVGGWLLLFAALMATSHLTWFKGSQKTITVFCWSDFFAQEKLDEFEQMTGIHVKLNFYETNEELLAKLRMTNGKGYDIIIPTDFAAQVLIKEGFAKKIDHARLPCFERIHPALLGHYFDPHNEYTVPILWCIYGLGIDRSYFKALPPSTWRLIFEPTLPYTVVMSEEAHEVVFIASQYLYGDVEALTTQKLEAIYQLAYRQRQWVEAYNDNRADYFVGSGICPVAASLSGDMMRMARQCNEHADLDFIIPQEGGFVVIDNILIPAASTNDDLVYPLIEYLYQEEVIDYHVKRFPFIPVTYQSLRRLDEEHLLPSFSLAHTLENFSSLSFFKNVLCPEEEHRLWVRLRAL